ncbi:hypothetical protein LJB77_01490 [Ruminococcaceae bacterium OttesenSCG-928-N02]|nr:hypothetical protein [Ruminococcaceae bacterium OttesenSCG-928-N02]
MTKQEAKQAALRWLDEATINGGALALEQTADYTDRMNYILPAAIDFFSGQFPLTARHSVVQNPVQNLLCSGYESVQVLPGTPYTVQAAGAGSFYLEVEGVCNVQVVADGHAVSSHSCISSGEFSTLCGNLPAGEWGQTSITVKAVYPSVVRHVALYPCRFFEEKVPPFTPYTLHQMPADFKSLSHIVHTTGSSTNEDYAPYRTDGAGRFLLPRMQAGQFDFIYHRHPATLAPTAKEDTVLDIDPRAQTLLPLKLAVDLTTGTAQNAALSAYLNGHFSAMLGSALSDEREARSEIQRVYHLQ